MKSPRRFVLAASALFLASSHAGAAMAQVVVYDPSNYAQSVLTAARGLQQINNQVVSLQNQAQSLINQARNLASLPTSTLNVLQSDLARTQQLLSQAQHITYNTGEINQAFATQYGQASLTVPQAQLVARAQTRGEVAPGDPRLYAFSLMGPMVMAMLFREVFGGVNADAPDLQALAAQHARAAC